jgi:uncharacterized cupredoxin-like copper-binding protein
MEDVNIGEAGDPTNADRVVVVETLEEDGFAYQPPTIPIAPGETITFEVTKPGAAEHQFVIGSQAIQDEHEEEMREEGMQMHDDPNSMSVAPGHKKTLTWTFPEEIEGELCTAATWRDTMLRA